MGRKHLTMGINIDPFTFGLFEYFLQIFQVMAGNQNRLALFCSQRNLGRDRMAVSSGIAGIQKFHGPQIDLPAFENQVYPVIEAQIFPQAWPEPHE